MPAGRKDLLVAQYVNLAAQIANARDMRWEWQKLGLFATFGFYGFFLTLAQNGTKHGLNAALWLPVLLNVMGLWYSILLRKNISDLAIVIKRIETELGCEDIGWEHTRVQHREQSFFWSRPNTITHFTFWIIMSFVSVLAATKLPN